MLTGQAFAVTVDKALSVKDYYIWHTRLGHPSYERFQKPIDLEAFSFKLPSQSQLEICKDCARGKAIRIARPKDSKTIYSSNSGIVYLDLFGPTSVKTRLGTSYNLVILCEDTYFSQSYMLVEKSGSAILACIKDYWPFYETHRGYRIKIARSDNGTEFLKDKVSQYTLSQGTIWQTTSAYEPWQNKVERTHLTLANSARSIMETANMPRIPTTPYEMWFKTVLKHFLLRCIGCIAYVTKVPQTSQITSNAWEGVLVGYGLNSQTYRVYSPTSDQIREVRSVRFDEDKLYWSPNGQKLPWISEEHAALLSSESDQGGPHSAESPTSDLLSDPPLDSPSSTEDSEPAESEDDDQTPKSNPFKVLHQSVAAVAEAEEEPEDSPSFDLDVPRTAAQALASKLSTEWNKAMQAEMDSLTDNKTWEIVDFPSDNSNSVDCRWVFAIKRKPDGSIIKFKARLVACGLTQR
ncbi:DNA-directed DNA polymerase [Powellomyces hirtus]|uniref:DNA-directed DNA polymerase n=1 Tax=Powellomyces hirtus TaxID=109895 RepID=A0A507DQM8_9FUNG|nr:DNA-directed DNA polymerase [Powellomyces hirtus]